MHLVWQLYVVYLAHEPEHVLWANIILLSPLVPLIQAKLIESCATRFCVRSSDFAGRKPGLLHVLVLQNHCHFQVSWTSLLTSNRSCEYWLTCGSIYMDRIQVSPEHLTWISVCLVDGSSILQFNICFMTPLPCFHHGSPSKVFFPASVSSRMYNVIRSVVDICHPETTVFGGIMAPVAWSIDFRVLSAKDVSFICKTCSVCWYFGLPCWTTPADGLILSLDVVSCQDQCVWKSIFSHHWYSKLDPVLHSELCFGQDLHCFQNCHPLNASWPPKISLNSIYKTVWNAWNCFDLHLQRSSLWPRVSIMTPRIFSAMYTRDRKMSCWGTYWCNSLHQSHRFPSFAKLQYADTLSESAWFFSRMCSCQEVGRSYKCLPAVNATFPCMFSFYCSQTVELWLTILQQAHYTVPRHHPASWPHYRRPIL